MNTGRLQLESIDFGQAFDWGKTSEDYARFRPGPPPSFYEKLNALDIGLPGSAMLDLGTGTGAVIREFAKRGVVGSAIDISKEQLAAADNLAKEQGLTIDFRLGAAEQVPFAEKSFDTIIAQQCWFYFDAPKVIQESRRLLKEGGRLVVSHFNFSPYLDELVRETEAIILKHNPKWTGANWEGKIPAMPSWAAVDFNLRGMFYYDEPIAFDQVSWRGRIRACRGISAALDENQVKKFDDELSAWLKKNVPETFNIIHRIDAHIFELK